MIRQGAFDVDPWVVRESTLDLDLLAQAESVFALSNGHIGLRGNLDEGEPNGLPGTYLNGFHESVPLPYAEGGYGYPESGQTVVNATNGKLIRLLVGDEPFDLRYGHLESHERVLDLRAGTLRREVVWTSPTGDKVRIISTRLVSLAQRSIAAIDYRVEPIDKPLRIVVQSELVANEPLPTRAGDPRSAAAAGALESELHSTYDLRGVLVHRTKRSGLRMAASYDHVVDGPSDLRAVNHSEPDLARTTISTVIEPGKPLRLTKFVAYGWSRQRSTPALRDQVAAAVLEANHTGLGRPPAPPARVPRRLLGPSRRRDRRRGAPSAGAAVRDVPRPSGRRAQRGSRDSGEGPDRLGLRRARLLGHRDLRAADAHLLAAGGRA